MVLCDGRRVKREKKVRKTNSNNIEQIDESTRNWRIITNNWTRIANKLNWMQKKKRWKTETQNPKWSAKQDILDFDFILSAENVVWYCT